MHSGGLAGAALGRPSAGAELVPSPLGRTRRGDADLTGLDRLHIDAFDGVTSDRSDRRR